MEQPVETAVLMERPQRLKIRKENPQPAPAWMVVTGLRAVVEIRQVRLTVVVVEVPGVVSVLPDGMEMRWRPRLALAAEFLLWVG